MFAAPMPAGIDADLAVRVDELAPTYPPYVDMNDEAAVARWEMCARLAVLLSLKLGEGLSDSEHRQFAWRAARTYYHDAEMPMGDPE